MFYEITLEEVEKNGLELTRHKGRSGKNGTCNPRRNDRRCYFSRVRNAHFLKDAFGVLRIP